jgi:hypothetical protein
MEATVRRFRAALSHDLDNCKVGKSDLLRYVEEVEFLRTSLRQAEADRRAADEAAKVEREDARDARQALFQICREASALCDYFEDSTADPEVRGLVRKLRSEVERAFAPRMRND